MAKDEKKLNRKGKEIKEYPKLVSVGDKRVKVLNAEDEAKLLNTNTNKEDNKKKSDWGK